MHKTPLSTYLWPGLSQLWTYGSWTGLLIAVVAGSLLNLLLLVSFGWSELLTPMVRNVSWGLFGVSWVVAAYWSAGQTRLYAVRFAVDPKKDTFDKAQEFYLQGNYNETEQILEGLLRRNVRDLEARLLLATLLRRTGRLAEADRHLDALSKFEGVEKWELEIQQERELLAEARVPKPMMRRESQEPTDSVLQT